MQHTRDTRLPHPLDEADGQNRQATELPSLDEYVDLQGLLDDKVKQTFPTKDSALWFVRRHRDALAGSGAVIIIAGRMRFHPARFKQAAVEIGQKAAA